MPNSKTSPRKAEPSATYNEIVEHPISTNEIDHLENITLLFFAYRDFTADADRALRDLDFGRAHHRVLFFVSRKPGMRVAELLQILRITKQSLARVLRQMVAAGYIEQKTGSSDRRHRLLFPTPKGMELILLLSRIQSSRISKAINKTKELSGTNFDNESADLITNFLTAMIDPQGQREMQKLASLSQNEKTEQD